MALRFPRGKAGGEREGGPVQLVFFDIAERRRGCRNGIKLGGIERVDQCRMPWYAANPPRASGIALEKKER